MSNRKMRTVQFRILGEKRIQGFQYTILTHTYEYIRTHPMNLSVYIIPCKWIILSIKFLKQKKCQFYKI